MLMKAPSTYPYGSTVVLEDGSLVNVDQEGFLMITDKNVMGLLRLGFVPTDAQNPVAWRAGRFYVPTGEALAAVLTVASVLYAHPIFVPNAIALANINCNVTTGQTGGVVTMGIYADAGGLPGALIVAATEQAATATAVATFAITNVLNPGWYWLASQFKATTTMPSVMGIGVSAPSPINAMLGNATAANAMATAITNNVTGVNKTSYTYVASTLPNLFPAPAYISGATCPLIGLGT